MIRSLIAPYQASKPTISYEKQNEAHMASISNVNSLPPKRKRGRPRKAIVHSSDEDSSYSDDQDDDEDFIAPIGAHIC